MTIDPTVGGFLKIAHENELEAMVHYEKFVGYLERVDRKFRGLMIAEHGDRALARVMVLVAHSYFLAAIRTALSGQSPPAFTNLRAGIECALYSVIIQHEEGADQVWLNREKDRATCRSTFTAAKGFRLLEFDPNLKVLAQQVYDASIDFGAHPNPLAVIKHLQVKDEGDAFRLSLISLHGIDSVSVTRALTACVETGLVCTLIFSQTFGDNEASASMFNLLQELQAFLGEGLSCYDFNHLRGQVTLDTAKPQSSTPFS
jgi:hypothetical protein